MRENPLKRPKYAPLAAESIQAQSLLESPDWLCDIFRERMGDVIGLELPAFESAFIIDPRKLSLDNLVGLELVTEQQVQSLELIELARLLIHTIPAFRKILETTGELHPVFHNARNFVTADGVPLVISSPDDDPRLSVYTSAFSRVRGLVYAQETGHREGRDLGKIHASLNWVKKLITSRWDEITPEAREQLSMRLRSAVEKLQHAVLAIKKKAKGHLIHKLDFTDILGRLNPIASAAAIYAAILALEERMKETVYILGFLAQDNRDFVAVIREGQEVMSQVMRELTPLAPTDKPPSVQKREDDLRLTDVDLSGTNLDSLIRRIEIMRESLQPLRVNPFRTYGTEIDQLLREAAQTLEEAKTAKRPRQKRDDTLDILVQAFVQGKFFEAQRVIERHLYRIAQGKRVDTPKAQQELIELRKLLSGRQFAGTRIVQSYQDGYRELYGFVNEYIDLSSNPGTSIEACKERAKSFPFEQKARQLGKPVQGRLF